MEIKEAKEVIQAGLAWANWTEEQQQAMKKALESMSMFEKVKDENLDLKLQLQSTKPLYSRRLLEENIEMAIHETELLHKTIKPSVNSNIDRRFKNIVEILKG